MRLPLRGRWIAQENIPALGIEKSPAEPGPFHHLVVGEPLEIHGLNFGNNCGAHGGNVPDGLGQSKPD